MIDFLAGFYSGVALGWIVSQLFSRRRRVPLIRSRRRYSNLLELPPLPRRWEESPIQRGNGHGGPITLKPEIVPKPQFPSPREIPGDTP